MWVQKWIKRLNNSWSPCPKKEEKTRLILKEQLKIDLSELKSVYLSKDEVDRYTKSFDHFCNLFLRSRVVDRRLVPEKLELELGEIRSRGKIDALLRYPDDSYLLIDFKLKKFGKNQELLEFFELLQLLLYYNELKRRNINIKSVAYYFFEERIFLVESTSTPPFSNSAEMVQRIIDSLLQTYFKPIKCALLFDMSS